MGLEFIGLLINKEVQQRNIETQTIHTDYNSPKIVKKEELTPKTRTKMRKIKSEEDFVKFQVPWIL